MTFTGLNLTDWTELAKTVRLDPYALWALHTGFRTFRGRDGALPEEITFLAELTKPYDPSGAQRQTDAMAPHGGRGVPGASPQNPAQMPAAYQSPLPNKKCPSFVTVRLPTSGLDEAALERYFYDLILNNKTLKRIQVGLPKGGESHRKEDSTKHEPPAPAADDPKVVLGVLDDQCVFAHAALRKAPLQTKVSAWWDQSTNNILAAPWTPISGFPYGRQISNAELNKLLAKYDDGNSVDEAALYDDECLDSSVLSRRSSHCAPTLTLLAGSGRAAPGLPQSPDAGDRVAQSPSSLPSRDDAGQAPLVVVQFPEEQMRVTGRWLAVHALDGLHYIVEAARQMGLHPDKPPPLVVNMSYGTLAGPHDGSGMLESAIDELCKSYKGELAVVLAAGNNHGTRRIAESGEVVGDEYLNYRPSGIHGEQTLKPGETCVFTLMIPPDKQFETYLEMWFSAGDELRKGDMDVTVIQPDGTAWSPVSFPGVDVRDDMGKAGATHQTAVAGLFCLPKVSQGKRSMALLVVAATQVSSGRVEALPGRWQIKLHNRTNNPPSGARSFKVEAWVERDDTVVGATRGQSARLVENADGSASGLSDRNTFTAIATGTETFRVGAVMDRGDSPAMMRASAYTAEGASGNAGPEFCAVADSHPALTSIRVAGSQSGMVVRAHGTSVAAPQVARWLANQLAAGKKLNSLRPRGSVDARRGRPI